MGKRVAKVLEADYHRNGIAGNGFFVAIVNDPRHGRMLVVDFTDQDSSEYGNTAVINLDMASEGNIYMHSLRGKPGGNAWRGDALGDEYRPLIRAVMDERWSN